MSTLVCALVAFVSTLFRSRLTLQLENVALRHQLTVYQCTTKRHGLARETVFSGPGSHAAGPGGGMRRS